MSLVYPYKIVVKLLLLHQVRHMSTGGSDHQKAPIIPTMWFISCYQPTRQGSKSGGYWVILYGQAIFPK